MADADLRMTGATAAPEVVEERRCRAVRRRRSRAAAISTPASGPVMRRPRPTTGRRRGRARRDPSGPQHPPGGRRRATGVSRSPRPAAQHRAAGEQGGHVGSDPLGDRREGLERRARSPTARRSASTWRRRRRCRRRGRPRPGCACRSAPARPRASPERVRRAARRPHGREVVLAVAGSRPSGRGRRRPRREAVRPRPTSTVTSRRARAGAPGSHVVVAVLAARPARAGTR